MASERVERKLAAILAANVAGYSRLVGADEEGTLGGRAIERRVFERRRFETAFDELKGQIDKAQFPTSG